LDLERITKWTVNKEEEWRLRGTRMIVCDCGHAQGSAQVQESLTAVGAQVSHTFQLIPGMAAGMSPEALQKFFERFPDAKVLPDRRRQIPPMPFSMDEWKEIKGPAPLIATSPEVPEVSPLALSLMKADDVQALGFDGTGVKVCVIDSGIDFSHPDLQGTALVGADGNPLAVDFTETDLADTVGHGTAVAGCIASQGRQVYTITDEQSGAPAAYTKIKGIAPGARFMSAKVFDTRVNSGYDSSIIAALEWAAANGAQIINMSLGGVALPNDGTDPLAAAVTAVRQQGILVIISAGNEGGGQGSLGSPGSSPGALTVGASTMFRSFSELGFLAEPGKWTADQMASFSSIGPTADGRLKPEILAPGAFDWGLAPVHGAEEGSVYQLFGGTSQAAPLMTGAACLVYQAFNKQNQRYPTPDEAVRIACSTADDLGFPSPMQGAGRVNCLAAVQAILGQSHGIMVSHPEPVRLTPGSETKLYIDLTNTGAEGAQVSVKPTRFDLDQANSVTFSGRIATAQSPQEIHFNVAPDTELMHISLGWQMEQIGGNTPRLMVALYDPAGNFANYQRPNTTGGLELGKSVDTWIARPMAGRWTARVVLRLGQRDTNQEYALSVRTHQRKAWDWVAVDQGAQTVPVGAGESTQLTLTVKVPQGTAAGAYAGYVAVGNIQVPVAVVVPIALEQGSATFAGSFQHGYQGSWGNGDWIHHDLPIPAGTKSLVTSVQWPDVDNALEFYLVDPTGNPVMGRSNNEDILADGDTDQLGSQIVLANPTPGTWRLITHSFAYCGRSQPEPYSGTVEVAGELVSPRTIQMRVARGEGAPVALLVRNPGRLPMTIQALAHTAESRLIWHPISAEIKAGIKADGRAEGEGQVTLGTVKVPFGARQLGVVASWSEPDVEVCLSMFDPVAQGNRASNTSMTGQVSVLETHPVVGEWTVMAGITSPSPGNRTVTLKGATFVVAPEQIDEIKAEAITVQPGNQALLPLTLRLPDNVATLTGQILVTTTQGDRLGSLSFQIQADDKTGDGDAHGTAAATKE
jgi:subtilisin family serine protease